MKQIKHDTLIRTFATRQQAVDRANLKNDACRAAGNRNDTYVIADGPEKNFVVIHIKEAKRLEIPCTYVG